jgi:hypothetical protein
MKSRKYKEQLRKIIKIHLNWHQGFTKASQIKYLYDDYDYWMARTAHKILHPNTPDSFYLT